MESSQTERESLLVSARNDESQASDFIEDIAAVVRKNLNRAENKMFNNIDEQTLHDYKEIYDIFDQDNSG